MSDYFDKTQSVDERIDSLHQKALPVKVAILAAFEKSVQRADQDRKILDAFYKRGKGLTVIAVLGNYAILEYRDEDELTPGFRSAYLKGNAWVRSNYVTHSVEAALLQVIGEAKGDGNFAEYAMRLLPRE